MDALFEFLNRYFWLVAIAVAALNTLILWLQAQPRIRQDPSLLPGYVFLTRGYWFCLSLPWFVMGAGILWGGIPAIWYFLAPQSGNPYVVTWWAVWWLLLAFVTQWIVMRGGAEMLVRHPGFVRGNPTNPKFVKLSWLFLLALCTAMTIYAFAQPPLPPPNS